MIWLWIRAMIDCIHWLLVPPPAPPVKPIDINAPCPTCGHRSGKLSAGLNGTKPACVHTCLICGAQFFEDPVLPSPAVTGAPLKVALPAATPSTPAAQPTTAR